MVLSQSISWYNVPAREFPIKRWMRQRYPFRVPCLAFAQVRVHSASDGFAPRPFPAKVWLEQRAGG